MIKDIYHFIHNLRHSFAKRGKSIANMLRSRLIGVKYVHPNYAFLPRLNPGDVMIDVGTGPDPDLSKFLINEYQMECYAVDPTRKHSQTLRDLQAKVQGFHYLPYALGKYDKIVPFFESITNISGSILPTHRNVLDDPTTTYRVKMITLVQLLETIGRPNISLLKIDVEGAEYGIINALEMDWILPIKQIIVEFHHNIVGTFSWSDTRQAIAKLESMGMKAFVYNRRDCLFYW